ncbi:nmra-like family protein [Colletotrichum truncatum]|uniref:Nmra-like family protein n=1 Tax=Colletotrichum truncatum TaxID=5467 RepID=A0ACC3Z0A9_COLTU|nr:nmra-like family protein [Colletotrichum truncatum]KAF6800700.1 nmra-like family protein [Colletotrichum truncatum]
MVKVAVAGGSGGIGRAIFDSIEESRLHDAFILSRTPSDDPKVIEVDYSDIKKLRETLEAHQIHTVISTLSIKDDESGQAQMNLIEASVQCQHTKRFMPSEFGAKYDEEAIRIFPSYIWKFKAVDRLKETDLEYTQFSNSMFMDLWFAPRIKSAFTYNMPCWVDLENDVAAIPGDGNTPMVATHSRDIAPFVAATLGLDVWEKRYYLTGDRFTINEFVAIAEEVKGVEFEKHYESMEVLDRGEGIVLPAIKAMLPPGVDSTLILGQIARAGKMVAQGRMDLPQDTGSINAVFPEMKTLTLREAIQTYYDNK